MASILTNASALAALSTLRSINSEMETTQARISSGKKVATASDNAAYWSIATTMKSDKGALSTVQDSMGLGASKVDTAYAGMETAIEIVDQIKKKLVTAQESTADKKKIQAEITELQGQLKSVAESASFNGENWLKADINTGTADGTSGRGVEAAVVKKVVGSFTRDANGDVAVQMIDVNLSKTSVLFDTGTSAAGLKLGILDEEASVRQVAYKIKAADTETVQLKAYSSDQLKSLGTVADIVSKNTVSNGTTTATTVSGGNNLRSVTDSNGASTYYIQLDGTKDNWVKAKEVDATATTLNEVKVETKVGAGTATNKFYVVEAGELVAKGETKGYSVSTIDITKLKGSDAENKLALDDMIQFVSTQYEAMTKAASNLGSTSMRIQLQDKFVQKLSSSIEKGIGRLVDADMNEESTRLKALQTQQQLGVQALTIANSNSQNILSLFR